MSKPKRTSSEHVLHFADLSPRDFERLCLWLLRKEDYTDVDHVGAVGSDEGCDLSATKDGDHWVCQCKRVGQFGPKAAEEEIAKIFAWPEPERPDDILFMVTCDISKKTRERARKKAGTIRCHFWPLTDLDERVKAHKEILVEFFKLPGADPDPYSTQYGFAVLDYLCVIDKLVDRERIQEFFVPIAGAIEVNECFESVDVGTFITNWLVCQESTHLAVLGDYGTGKSWLCLRLTKQLADAFREAPSVHPLPLLLSFKSYKSGMDLPDLISTAMARDYGLASCDTYRIQETIRERETILILDGLDEMARELGHRDALVQFARLGVPTAARAIVTCRTHYFLSGTEQREVLNPDAAVHMTDGTPNFDILHLKLFDETRVEDAIRRRVKTDAEGRAISFVRSTYNLPELCARPILLALVCQSHEALKTLERDVTSADLYDSYLKAWLARELQSGRLSIRPADVLQFLQKLAEILLRRNSLWLSGREFEHLVAAFGTELGLSEIATRSLARQLATSTFLSRTRGDGWQFVHRSFQEYLYAKRFFEWERETNGIGDFPVTHVPAWQFISQVVLHEWNEEKAQKWIVERVRRDKEPSLCKTTLRAAAAYWLLHRGRQPASEYWLRGVMLDCVDLRRMNFCGADLTRSDLNNSDLRGVNLQSAILRDSLLISADCSGADLRGADLRGSDCRGTTFEGANTLDVLWEGARLGPAVHYRTY